MIIKLPISISNQIAAGEVVERPSSVVKELVENSIDAGAKFITVDIINAGKDMIFIKDDGTGIQESDIPMVFERNATSKIKTIEDVYNVSTLGFRGEALASISAVSKVNLISRHKDAALGRKITFYDGEIKHSEETACTVGTSIKISDLFYNTPARYKFLKSESSEKSKIISILTNIALANPSISFTLVIDEKEIFRTPGNGNLRDLISILFGKDFEKSLIEIDSSKNDIHIHGFVSNPEYTKGNRSQQFLFVNNRTVESKFISNLMKKVYENMLMKGRHSAYLLKIDLPYSAVDVNIHPQKLEIKFEREDILESMVYNVCRNALVNRKISRDADINRIAFYKNNIDSHNNTSSGGLNNLDDRENNTDLKGNSGFYKPFNIDDSNPDKTYFSSKLNNENLDNNLENYQIFSDGSKSDKLYSDISYEELDYDKADFGEANDYEPYKSREIKDFDKTVESKYIEDLYLARKSIQEKNEAEESYVKGVDFDKLEIIGQVLKTFIVCQYGSSVYYIDQHAAHERVLFERFYEDFKSKKIANQILMQPFKYKSDLGEEAAVKEAMNFMESIGLEFEQQDEVTWLIKSLPIFVEPISEEEFKSLIDKFAENKTDVYHSYFVDYIIMKSCKAAIKAGDVLNEIQMRDLLNMLKKCESPHSCPHGRPTTIEMKRTDFDKLFKRIV